MLDQSIVQTYSKAVDMSQIETYITDMDLEDYLKVEDYGDPRCASSFVFTYNKAYFDRKIQGDDALHWHLDRICELVL